MPVVKITPEEAVEAGLHSITEADWQSLREGTPRTVLLERERFRIALQFYADPKNYDQFGVCHNDPEDCACRMKHHHPDNGATARRALLPTPTPVEP